MFEDTVGDFKRGVGALAVRTGAPVLPVAIRWQKSFLFYRVHIYFGNPMRIGAHFSYEEAALEVQKEVSRLYEELKRSG